MAEHKLLLTTSGVGSRLGELTKYTNKSLIRVGKKPAISYVIDQYQDDVEIVVTLGYHGKQVKDFLELAYPNRKFTFVDVNPYEGDKSSLLYSMLCAESVLQCPFIFHACDTITFDKIPEPSSDWCAGFHQTGKSSQYRTHIVSDKKLIKINEKGGSHFDRVHIGVCGIHSFSKFWEVAHVLYNDNPHNSQLSDCHVINELLNKDVKISAIPFSSWLDIGNIEVLEKARKEIYDSFHILDKVDESIFIFDTFVIKFFYNKQISDNRVERANILSGIVPKVIDTRDNFYKYEFTNGVPLSTSVNLDKFFRLLCWSRQNLWKQQPSSPESYSRCKNFYFTKTRNRVQEFLSANNIVDGETTINGLKIPSVEYMLSRITPDTLCTEECFRFHGDFILDNIIDSNGEFVLIDWRQDFGGSLTEGDVYYDLAKLNHNLVFNHDIVTRGLFSVEETEDNIKCDIMRSNMLVDCQEVLYDFIEGNGLSLFKVKLLTPIIWLNMSPLHEYPISTFLFYFGKYNLYKTFKEANNV